MKLIAIRQFVLVVMAWQAFCGFAVTCSSNGNYTDRLSLLEFKKAISLDPKQALVSWNASTRLCSWEGVQCSVKHPQRVSSLHLENLGLVGLISPSLGNLTFLRVLNLATNSLTGEIPASLRHLHRLEILCLSNNTLQGKIPSLANCSKLNELALSNNHLVGQIPTDLPNGIQKLILSSNNLTGNILSSLANVTTLEALCLRHNSIQGGIPNDFAKLPWLQYLDLKQNKLSGPFPQVILNLSNLIGLSISGNDFSGYIPQDIGNSLPNLQNLYLDANFFCGHIPSSIANASKLNFIGMSRNNFTGVIPSSIGKLHKLFEINLEFNMLQANSKQDWGFMDSLTNCTELQSFSVSGNSLKGIVPNSLGNLSSQLQYLFLAKNELSGKFPAGIVNLRSLIVVALRLNQFMGTVPEWLGTLKSLQILRLDSNIFTGHLPSSLSNLSNLIGLDLDSNQLDGHIPPSLGDLQMLAELSIVGNRLYGIIPKELFGIPTLIGLSLSSNNLYGPLHTDIGNAKHLTYLQLSSNKLSGEIPNTLENSESLEDIELDGNNFSGSIPISLGNISSLLNLNLSHNNLTGPIPVSLGSLQLLEHLDLSFNHLAGEIPTKGIFTNVSSVKIDGNLGLCGGKLEMHLLPCSALPLNSRKHKDSILKKVVIPIFSIVALATIIYVVLLWKGKQKKKSIYSNSFGSNFQKVSYNDLARATEGFSTSNLIGQGRYSSVYQANLFQDGTVVAVKVFNLKTKGTHKSFVTECNALRNIRHRNLVPILTACSSIDLNGNDFKALVYKFMQRGDLHVLLYSTRDDGEASASNRITLAQRLRIVVDVADALEYLHHNTQGIIVHCDLKPSNILLDDNMIAHVGDFGLARFRVDSAAASSFSDMVSTSSIAIKGTVGYVPPEYASGADVSSSGDVYSFGIVLLEIFLRKRPTDDMFRDGLDLARYVDMNFPDRILQIVDPELLEEHHVSLQQTSEAMKDKMLECLLSVLNIGLRCAKSSPNERMDMREVAAMLRHIKESFVGQLLEAEGV